MNVRNIIKMQRVELSRVQERSHDNPYEYKIDLWHGLSEAPYHELTTFTEIELREWLNNLNILEKTISGLMHEFDKPPNQDRDN